MITQKRILINSVVVYLLGLILGHLSLVVVPNTIYKWESSIQYWILGLMLIGVLYVRQMVGWIPFQCILLSFGLVAQIMTIFDVIPSALYYFIVLVLVGLYFSSHPNLKDISFDFPDEANG